MIKSAQHKKVAAILNSLDIPPSAFEKAHKRYKDLGDWFDRPESKCSKFAPRIYPQGSFRLGTVVRPIDENGAFDLDVGCRLESGVSKSTHTQADLKELVRGDLEAYRQARQIEQQLDEKRRCWTLEYSDSLNFHMDVVPSIPEDETQRGLLQESMIKCGAAKDLAEDVTEHAGAITDKTDANYRTITQNWRVSNSEGYAKWFESRIRLCRQKVDEMAIMAKQANVEEMPTWEWKSPLQEAVQILKFHRDRMYKNAPDSKPISIILTTLAGESYQGEQTTAEALERILADLDKYVLSSVPRVPNPVNPAEDFADKWYNREHAHLKLEDNFKLWLKQARVDFEQLKNLADPNEIQKFAERAFGTRIKQDDLEEIERLLEPVEVQLKAPYIITQKPPEPWCA